jgi:hypothetical protein
VINYATALEKDLDMHLVAGEGCFCPGFPEYTTDALERMRTTKVTNIDVWISHKPPDRYPIFPYNGLVTYSERPNYVIGYKDYLRLLYSQLADLFHVCCSDDR